MIERFNRTTIDMIAVYTNQNQTDWDKHLPMPTVTYRSCVHEKTGYTSNLLMLGREVNLPIELVLGATQRSKGCTEESQYVLEIIEKLNAIFQLVRESLKINSPKKDCDPRISLKTYKVGDLVYYRDNTRTVGQSPTLKSKFGRVHM